MIPGNLGIIFTGDTQYPPCESGEMSQHDSQHKPAAVMGLSECAKIWREINMADEKELYLANLDEFVNDEDKIVSELT